MHRWLYKARIVTERGHIVVAKFKLTWLGWLYFLPAAAWQVAKERLRP